MPGLSLRTAASIDSPASLKTAAAFGRTIESFSASVAASADDANEVVSSGVVSIVGTTIGLQPDRHGGFRFNNVTVPNGAVIHSARVQFVCGFTAVSSGADACDVVITGEDADDAAAFTTGSTNVTGRTDTTATVTWELPASSGDDAWTEGDAGLNQRTPNLATIVQEIVDRAGWASGADLVLLFAHDNVGLGARVAAAFDHATLDPPTLTILYSTS